MAAISVLHVTPPYTCVVWGQVQKLCEPLPTRTNARLLVPALTKPRFSEYLGLLYIPINYMYI